MTKETVSARIREKRKEQRLTQQELADKAGVSLKTIQRWENGERSPRADEMNRLAEALKVSPGYFLDGADDNLALPEGITERKNTNMTRERNTNMAVITLDGGRRVEAPATPEGYAFLKEVFAMSLAGAATA